MLSAAETFQFSLSTSALGGLNGGSPLAIYTGATSSLTEGVFTDKSLSLVVQPGNPNIGGALRVDIGATKGSGGGWAWFDNVRLDYSTTVPEPSALALLATGLIGLLAYAWRKRK